MSRKQKREKSPKKEKNVFQRIFLWLFEIIIVVLFAYVLVFFFGQTRTNIGQSMDVTLAGGDKVLLNELIYKIGDPKRNDVVAFKPNGNEGAASSIKRVIGLPGETIQIKDGMIYINGNVYLEKKDYPAMADAGIAEESITLGTDEYFVLGDNRNNSEDSRYADVGVVDGDTIEGKVWFVISPKEHLGLVK